MEYKHAKPAGVDEEIKREILNFLKVSEHSIAYLGGDSRRGWGRESEQSPDI